MIIRLAVEEVDAILSGFPDRPSDLEAEAMDFEFRDADADLQYAPEICRDAPDEIANALYTEARERFEELRPVTIPAGTVRRIIGAMEEAVERLEINQMDNEEEPTIGMLRAVLAELRPKTDTHQKGTRPMTDTTPAPTPRNDRAALPILAAAPDLLAALEELIEWMDKSGLSATKPGGVGAFRHEGTEYSPVTAARAAIAKAKGGAA